VADKSEAGFAWQVGVWDRMAEIYQQEIDRRFAPVIQKLLDRAMLRPGEAVLDLGTGTASVAIMAASMVGPTGRIMALDISPEMLAKARARIGVSSLSNVELAEGRAEAIPASSGSFDAVLASLSLMYVIDRAAAAREIARALRPGGRFVATAWAGPENADIVLFQQTAGSFAPTPPVQGVGPGALADPEPFLAQLAAVGLRASCETDITSFQFSNFADAWTALAGVTTATLEPSIQDQAKAAVTDRMWPRPLSPREFRNATHIITAKKLE
jgi:Methylase involved in ubiquinone/menaquinone biosynthesis